MAGIDIGEPWGDVNIEIRGVESKRITDRVSSGCHRRWAAGDDAGQEHGLDGSRHISRLHCRIGEPHEPKLRPKFSLSAGMNPRRVGVISRRRGRSRVIHRNQIGEIVPTGGIVGFGPTTGRRCEPRPNHLVTHGEHLARGCANPAQPVGVSQLGGVATVGLFRVMVENVTCAKAHPLGVESRCGTVFEESEHCNRPRHDCLGLKRCSGPKLGHLLDSAQIILNAQLDRKVNTTRGRRFPELKRPMPIGTALEGNPHSRFSRGGRHGSGAITGRGKQDVAALTCLPGKSTLPEPVRTKLPLLTFDRGHRTVADLVEAEIRGSFLNLESDLGLVLKQPDPHGGLCSNEL